MELKQVKEEHISLGGEVARVSRWEWQGSGHKVNSLLQRKHLRK